MPGAVTRRLMTPRAGVGGASSGAIAIVQLDAIDENALTSFLESIGLTGIIVGDVALRDLLGVDTGLVVRWSGTSAQLMPHGGAVLVKQLEEALNERGASEGVQDPISMYPEARDTIEAMAMDAIARSASAEATDLILEHADRVRAQGDGVAFDESLARLDALIEPPTVVCVGRANAGKSSLLNALARRDVAVVSEMPGTTRDHVGVMLDLAGLVVRWVDMPGEREGGDELEARARELSATALSRAALIVHAEDGSSGFDGAGRFDGWRVVRVGTKLDLGAVEGASVQTSAKTGEGLGALSRAVRGAIVPRSALESGGIWRFHEGLSGGDGS